MGCGFLSTFHKGSSQIPVKEWDYLHATMTSLKRVLESSCVNSLWIITIEIFFSWKMKWWGWGEYQDGRTLVCVAGSLVARIRTSLRKKITEFSPHPYPLLVRDLCGDLGEAGQQWAIQESALGTPDIYWISTLPHFFPLLSFLRRGILQLD